MPIEIKHMSDAELAPLFARRPRGQENVDDYIEILETSKVGIGSGLTVKTQIFAPTEGDSYTILAGSVDDDDPKGVTIRAAKRRFNAAARELGFSLDWREVEGWLVMKGIELQDETDGKAQ